MAEPFFAAVLLGVASMIVGSSPRYLGISGWLAAAAVVMVILGLVAG